MKYEPLITLIFLIAGIMLDLGNFEIMGRLVRTELLFVSIRLVSDELTDYN